MGTHIQWCDEVWNPTTGCTRVSKGCFECYIVRTMPFRTAGRRFDRPGIGATTGVQLHPERLGKPLGWRKGRRVFVNSLSDVFHEDIPDTFVARVFAAMSVAGQHTFLLLTKRHGRMRALLGSLRFRDQWMAAHQDLAADARVRRAAERGGLSLQPRWPVPNVHLGVSVEDQDAAQLRIPALLDTPAAVRWLSCEPLVGPVDLTDVALRGGSRLDALSGTVTGPAPAAGAAVDWVVIGGESGPRARPMDPAWPDTLLTAARRAGRPVFFKQTGTALAKRWRLRDPKGGTPAEWPHPWPRAFPTAHPADQSPRGQEVRS